MQVIQVRGTGGSGKSWTVREILRWLKAQGATFTPHHIPGRMAPLYYTSDGLAVMGTYEGEVGGGCDSIGSARESYEAIMQARKYPIVLCEGLLLSEDVKWTVELSKAWGAIVWCIFLTTPLDQCLSQITARRLAKGNNTPLNPKNTTRRISTIERARLRLVEAGIQCNRYPAAQAVSILYKRVRRFSNASITERV
jgi:hypothetical protein